MTNHTNKPQSPDAMTPDDSAAATAPAAILAHPLPTIRADGWTGEKMAEFCEVLAETAVVAEACDMVRMSTQSAYKLRRRNPVFAAGWDAALTIARERLADTLLARSIEGNAELIFRNEELVGRREVIDNRLGLAILGRLDRLAETGRATRAAVGRLAPLPPTPSAPAILAEPVDWDLMLQAMRTRDPDDIAGALATLKSYEVDEVDDPRFSGSESENGEESGEDEEGLDLSDRCWKNEDAEGWLTDFPPPDGFEGYESGDYGDPDINYERECTAEETALIEADIARQRAAERAEDAALRDAWFDLLAADCDETAEEPAPLT